MACGPWHDGAGHFLTFYLCADYWSLLDPLVDRPYTPHGMQSKVHRALPESFRTRNFLIPDPPLANNYHE